MSHKIAVVGGGKIGYSIFDTLRSQKIFNVQLGDINPPSELMLSSHSHDNFCPEWCDKSATDLPGAVKVDAGDYVSLKQWLSTGFEVVLCATPYYLVKNVSSAAAELGLAYFDLTEDRDSTEHVKSLESTNVLVPQCGLAPGAVSVIAADLIKKFDEVKSVDIRVGALPLYPNNSIQYYLTWSTNGLVNEYCNLCEVIHEGKRMDVMPLEGYEKISIDGQTYEAFNTSGGIGSLCESLEGKVEKLTYKTIRYVGHHERMKFLLDDLGLNKHKDLFIKLFDQEVPQTNKDVVIVMVKVVGHRKGKLVEDTFVKKVYGDFKQSAIQKTTVGGICGAMMSWMTGSWVKTKGFVKQEEISLASFTNNFGGMVYN